MTAHEPIAHAHSLLNALVQAYQGLQPFAGALGGFPADALQLEAKRTVEDGSTIGRLWREMTRVIDEADALIAQGARQAGAA